MKILFLQQAYNNRSEEICINDNVGVAKTRSEVLLQIRLRGYINCKVGSGCAHPGNKVGTKYKLLPSLVNFEIEYLPKKLRPDRYRAMLKPKLTAYELVI